MHIYPTYLHIDSTYRNRRDHPEPSEFVVYFTNNGGHQDSISADDPIVDSYPCDRGTMPQPPLNPSEIDLGTDASEVDNNYINMVLETKGEFRKVASYNGTTKVATTVSPFNFPNGVPVAGDAWTMRQSFPDSTGIVQPGSTVSEVVLEPLSSSSPNVYTHQYLYIVSTDELRIISAYDSLTKTATLLGNLSVPPVAGVDRYEVMYFTKDNHNPMRYIGSLELEMSYFEVDLTMLILPNIPLASFRGGLLVKYPYVFVEFYNTSMAPRNLINSNNPNSSKAVFVVPIDDDAESPPFIQLAHCGMSQLMKFKPSDHFKFSVFLPNGELLRYVIQDTSSPCRPNHRIQISATFRIKKHVPHPPH